MIYKNFTIENFKGIENVTINLIKDDLVLLLGLNESGKTTILKAIETFDYLNDVDDDKFFRSIRNKSDVNSNNSAKITATIELDEKVTIDEFKGLIKSATDKEKEVQNLEAFLHDINKNKQVVISRIIPFKKGNPQKYYYEFETEHPYKTNNFSRVIAQEFVRKCPYIIYFEDFKDRIPEKIFTSRTNDAFNEDWYDIIDGLFYNTNKEYSIEQFKKLYSKSNPREKDAITVLKRVNKTLNQSFSDKWKELSGVKDIEETELAYNSSRSFFEISITDTDGTTFSVDERSKGALWYLSFLMKTEFRRKKLRVNSGKPIFLIDEPASNLHSTAQQNMIGDFQKLVEDTSVIYSTHSQYLISLENIKTTYIVERKDGDISSTLWSNFIKSNHSNISYYQPLANILNIIPNNFDIPWKKAVITEGPSDMNVLNVIFDTICNKKKDFVVYPGTSANNLAPLISLNLGWGADFKVLLDSDKEGKKAKERYLKEFDLREDQIAVLPLQDHTIENYFTKEEKLAIYNLAFDTVKQDKVNKKEFAGMFSILNPSKEKKKKLKKILEDDTIKRFEDLFRILNC
ncbi:ATP-dependent nuclease [Moheibacter stercoris]|uniref:ATP-dependent endonuclease of OLD family n=1 Tax=Moheibacter stercoris TaxID=1628251 RepID=A0ABV2LSB0_9FLAO